MTTIRDEIIPFIKRHYPSYSEGEVISMRARYLRDTLEDVVYRLNAIFEMSNEVIMLVGTELHEYVEAIEVKIILKKIIPIDHTSEEWKKAYRMTHPIALRLEAKYYEEKGKPDLAKEALKRGFETF